MKEYSACSPRSVNNGISVPGTRRQANFFRRCSRPAGEKRIPFTRLRGEGGQVWTYVLWIAVVCLVIGIIITQAGPIIWNHISIHGTASDAIDEAVITYQNSRGNMEKVNDVVQDLLESRDTRLEGTIQVTRSQAGGPVTISISVRKIVNTFLFENVGYLSGLTEAHASRERLIP